MSDALDRLGQLLMEQLRDGALDMAELVLNGPCNTPSWRSLHVGLAGVGEVERRFVLELVREAVDSGIHDLLFRLQEFHDDGQALSVIVSGTDVASETEGLHGELYGDAGWQARFSKYGQAPL